MSASKSQFGFNNYHLRDDVIELYIFWQINFDISLIWELSSKFFWICWYRLFTKPASSVAPMKIVRDQNVHKWTYLERLVVSSSSPWRFCQVEDRSFSWQCQSIPWWSLLRYRRRRHKLTEAQQYQWRKKSEQGLFCKGRPWLRI